MGKTDEPEVIEAEFELVEARFRFPWGAVIWWAVYVGCCAIWVSNATGQVERIGVVVIASLIVPAWISFSALAQSVGREEADLLRQRLSVPWGKAAGRAPSAMSVAEPAADEARRLQK